jgi:hypothetical protein
MNETLDAPVIESLERYSPHPRRELDWLDVLGRAGLLPQTKRAGGMRWRLTTTVAVAACALILTFAWPFGGRGSSVIQQALAAVGGGELTHVVFEDALGSRLVDLKTGAQRPVRGRGEIWYEPGRGLLETLSFRGAPVFTYFVRRPPRAVISGTQPGGIAGFVSGYRDALRSGAYHVVGRGQLAGAPVYWIRSRPDYVSGNGQPGPIKEVFQEVAISRTSFKPTYWRLVVDGHVVPGGESRVTLLRTLAPKPAVFAHPRLRTPSYGFTPSAPATTLVQARASMKGHLVIPPAHLAGLPRRWIGQTRYFTTFTLAGQLPGVEFFYGKLDASGGPIYTGNYISITEFPEANSVVRGMGTGYFPSAPQAILQNKRVTLTARGAYMIINLGGRVTAITAARAFR